MRSNDVAVNRMLARLNPDATTPQAVRQQAATDPTQDPNQDPATNSPGNPTLVTGNTTPTTAQFNSQANTFQNQDRSPQLMNALPPSQVGTLTQFTQQPGNQLLLRGPRGRFEEPGDFLLDPGTTVGIARRVTDTGLVGAAEDARPNGPVESTEEENPNAPNPQANPAQDQPGTEKATPPDRSGTDTLPDVGQPTSDTGDDLGMFDGDVSIWEALQAPLDMLTARGHGIASMLTAFTLGLGTYSVALDHGQRDQTARPKRAPDLKLEGKEEYPLPCLAFFIGGRTTSACGPRFLL